MNKFKGILFTLKKRIENISENDNDYYKYLVMGYYDGLEINTVDQWYKMRPRGLRELNLQVDISTPFVDQYTMRAFFPENRDDLENCGFDYEIWDKIGDTGLEEFRKDVIDERKKNPYICMSALNIADPLVLGDNLSSVSEILKSRLIESAENSDVLLSELHCAVFPSIGYIDYIVLFLTDDLNKVSRILSGLRKETNPRTLISGIYSVCGMDSANASCADTEKCSDVQIALYINLREGISIGNFIQGLDDEIDKGEEHLTGYREELVHLRTELKENVYLTFGYSDSMIVLYKSLSIYKQLYAENHILNPGHEFYKKYIANLRTSVRIKEKEITPESTGRMPDASEFDAKCLRYDEFIQQYSFFLERNNFPVRTPIGLKQIMKNYLNISSLTRSFDIETVVGGAFSALVNAVTYYINKSMELPDEIRGNEEEEELYLVKIKNEYTQTVEAVKLFKENIGDFIADLMRSDCAFIEGNTLSHPAIGSATKLLFAYTELLNRLTLEYKENDRIQFIAISGGCDKIESVDLFSFASPGEIEKIKKLIIISIPEMSLYDVQGTLFRILHECMHFIGDRDRKKRYRYIINALSEYMAHDITSMRFSERSLKKYIECAANGCDREIYVEISEKFRKNFARITASARRDIQQMIVNHKLYQDYLKHSSDIYYHREVVFFKVLRFECLADSLASDELVHDIYEILCKKRVELLESFTDILNSLYEREKHNNIDRAFRLRASIRQFSLQLCRCRHLLEEGECDRIEIKFVEDYFESFLYREKGGTIKLEQFYTEIADSVVSAMVECYSDCTSIALTEMPAEDFLLSFMYELWDVDQAFPSNLSDSLRMGADLKVMYGIKGCLGEELEARIIKKVNKKKEEGYVYRHIPEMIERINFLLSQYQNEKFSGIAKNIEGYIREICIYQRQTVYSGLKEMYRKCAFDDDSKDGYVYASISAMLCKWKELREAK